MSNITIFKLKDLDVDLFEDHTIKIKSKKNAEISTFSSVLNYNQIPHYKVTVNNRHFGLSGAGADIYDGKNSSGIRRAYVAYNNSKTVPITQGKIFCDSANSTFTNPITGESANPYTISKDITLNLVTKETSS